MLLHFLEVFVSPDYFHSQQRALPVLIPVRPYMLYCACFAYCVSVCVLTMTLSICLLVLPSGLIQARYSFFLPSCSSQVFIGTISYFLGIFASASPFPLCFVPYCVLPYYRILSVVGCLYLPACVCAPEEHVSPPVCFLLLFRPCPSAPLFLLFCVWRVAHMLLGLRWGCRRLPLPLLLLWHGCSFFLYMLRILQCCFGLLSLHLPFPIAFLLICFLGAS